MTTAPAKPHAHGLGRLHHPDPRDRAFLLRRPVEMPATVRKLWDDGPGGAWDQGATSQCVSYAANRYLASSPVRNKPPMSMEAFYHECQKVDEWAGTPHDGSSVRAAFKVLENLGYIGEYRWAFDVEAIIGHVLTKGPVDVGTDWTDPMFEPEKRGKFKGFVRVAPDGTYDVAGGHSYLLIGVDRMRKCPDGTVGAFRLINSWGSGWGEVGRAWVGVADFARLLANDGEAAVATELLKK